MKRILAAAAGLVFVVGASGASAYTSVPIGPGDYSFLYTLSTGVTDSGVLTGSLEGDGNTFDVTGLKSFLVNGAALDRPLSVFSTDGAYGINSSAPTATLDASALNFAVIATDGGGGFVTAVADQAASDVYGEDTIGAGRNFGGDGQGHAFVPADYSASYTPAAAGGGGGPEPSTWALMMVGVFGAGAALRRRQGLALVAAA